MMSKLGFIYSELKKYSQLVSTETSRSKLACSADMVLCGLKYGASPANYYKFDFACKPTELRKTFVTNRISNKMIRKYNKRSEIQDFENKISFMAKYREFTHREFLKYPECTALEYSDFAIRNQHFIAKPVDGSQGRGILVFTEPTSYAEIVKLLGSESYVIEAWIQQHEELNEFYDKAVNCIRVITVLEGDVVHYLCANITFGLEHSIANASFGGITCIVDPQLGTIVSDGGQYGHKCFKIHPTSDKSFKGYAIPFWPDVREMLDRAARVEPNISYVGWDIAITQKGPVIIEGNSSPGYTYFQIPQLLEDGKGCMGRYSAFIK